jgi:hypothetical protein
VICGGNNDGRRDNDKCYRYSSDRDAWDLSGKLPSGKRRDSAGASHPKWGYVVAAGSQEDTPGREKKKIAKNSVFSDISYYILVAHRLP